MASGPGALANRVYPSGFARATRSAPILPAAPLMFSMTTGWLQLRLTMSPTILATKSAVPPAGNGTMIATVAEGNDSAPWVRTLEVMTTPTDTIAAKVASRALRIDFSRLARCREHGAVSQRRGMQRNDM